MRKSPVLGAAIAAALLVAAAKAHAVTAFYTAEEYMTASEVERLGFVGGVYDAFAVLDDAALVHSGGGQDLLRRIFKCTTDRNWSTNDLDRVLVDYLNAHTDEWDTSPASILFFALDEVC